MGYLKDYQKEDMIATLKSNQIKWVLNTLNTCKDYLADSTIQKLVAYAGKMKEDVEQFKSDKQQLLSEISSVFNEQQRKIFILHVLEGKTFDEIAEEMLCSKRTVQRIYSVMIPLLESRC